MTDMRKVENFHFFYSGCSVFSQWYKSPFVDNNGQRYTSAEQYMMSEKAKLFNDVSAKETILKTHNPKICKSLGRKVKGFDEKKWKDNREQIVFNASIFKYGQNQELKDILLSTKDKHIVEASPYDKIWGIGMRESHKDATNPLRWKGLNLLGNALMRTREVLKLKISNPSDKS
jgi:ribA/ribD-fused uncharacterized protein